ncbi:hypothetical protein A11M_0122410 [Xanthomonas vasicola pv. vasculorum NCPPB 895]|nr:hypothetical protein A11M_0122410 [Xanthomonas vasicola pv. vasculorum NCPPB 895]
MLQLKLLAQLVLRLVALSVGLILVHLEGIFLRPPLDLQVSGLKLGELLQDRMQLAKPVPLLGS